MKNSLICSDIQIKENGLLMQNLHAYTVWMRKTTSLVCSASLRQSSFNRLKGFAAVWGWHKNTRCCRHLWSAMEMPPSRARPAPCPRCRTPLRRCPHVCTSGRGGMAAAVLPLLLPTASMGSARCLSRCLTLITRLQSAGLRGLWALYNSFCCKS